MKVRKLILLFFGFYFLIVSVLFSQSASQVYTETSASDFLDGTFSSTTIVGSGISASIVLSSFTIQWWDQNWKYRRVLYVFNFTPQVLNNFQVLFTTNTQALISAGKMKNDGSDIRFVAEDNQTVLPHYLESGINTATTKIWIKVSTIPAGSVDNPGYVKIYMYYGNPSATSTSDGRAVFEVFDDFSTDPRQSGYWDIYDRNQPTSACVWNSTAKTFSLTKNVSGTAGAIFIKNYSLPTNASWQAKFRYCVTNYNSQPDGGEGMTFMFYKQKFATGSYPDTGAALGFTSGGSGPGYGVELDAVWSGETDVSNAAHFALIKDVTYPHIAGTPYSTDAVRDEKWYTLELTFTQYTSSSNILVRTIDQQNIATDRINYTSTIDKTYTSLGFSAASSGNEHIIDDVIVRKYVFPEPVVIDDGEDPKDFYYALGSYRSSAFDCGAPSVISSVTWTATTPPNTYIDVYVFGSTGTTYNWIKVEKDKETNILTNGSLIEYSVIFYSTVAYLLKNEQGQSVLGIRETPRFDDITFYYKTRSAPLLQLTTFYFVEYNWEMNQFTIYADFSDSRDLDGQIVRYMWNFGDGETSTTQEPFITHTYYTVPTSSYTFTYTTYTLTVTAFDNDGFFSYLNILIPLPATPEILTLPEIPPPPPPPQILPIPVISAAEIVTRVNEPVTFDCSGSYDPDGEITDVFWWFGDYDTSISSGPFKQFATVTHTYVDIDTFTVYLFVLDNDFLSSSTTVKVIVRGYPNAKITSSKHNLGATKTITLGYAEELELDASGSYYPNGSIIQYRWDFGDGNVIISTTPIVKYTYSSVTSSYNVVLTVIGDDLLTSTDSVKVIVSARPIIDISAPTEGKVGETLVFDASSSIDIDGNIVSYTWSFGDGTSASGKVVSHVYNKEGTYKVTLVTTDNVGLTSSKEFFVTISKVVQTEEEISYLDKNKVNIYPVPFRISQKNLTISYYLDDYADVFISIYDIFGRQVKNFQFTKGSFGAMKGWNNISWNGVGINNEFVHSGVYVCKILIRNKTKKLLTEKFIVYR